jgi:hypothetical protein
VEVGFFKQFFERLISYSAFSAFRVFRENLNKILPFIREMIAEPLFWVILVSLIVLIITGYALDRKEKRKPDMKNICQYCKGYGELATQNKGQKKSAICPHCSGTGWTGSE